MNKIIKVLTESRWFSSLLFLIALFLITGAINPTFLSYGNIITCFNSSIVFILLAVGISFVIMTGEIDVSIGSTMGLSAAIAGSIAQQNGSWVMMVVYAILLGLAVGFVNGVGVAILKVPSLIFTLGTYGIVRGLVYIYSGGRTVENFSGAFTRFSNSTVGNTGIGIYLLIVTVIVLIINVVETKTRQGKYFLAVGDNYDGAILVGIPAKRTKLIAYILCGIFAAISGIAFSSKYGQVTIIAGSGYEMSAIAACVLGGISLSGGLGNVIGAAIGAVIMSSISRLLVFLGFSSEYDNTITGILLITIVVLDSLLRQRNVENARRERLIARSCSKKEIRKGHSQE
ncbi:MAG TPA: ABC transporter permease [Flexilinea sp.]|jgi:AI-2 transport system permease protein|nr:ABC transporter permease [Flexilinea sp.]HOR56396.1 ABC transporter permease [Flexilinea sp.]HOU20175.1 ABC transporter permease [Flexilinea sp.]HPJ65571.1 ABC transporter permease [Flexilinea sp.]HPR70567.1 ABC transporter permease [Flexilinea sp.]